MPIENPEDNDVPQRDEAMGNPSQSETHETMETPELSLTVTGSCKNQNGDYIGLSKTQREKLGVEIGNSVELFDEDESLGIFTVGSGSKEILKEPDKFTANVSEEYMGRKVKIRKASSAREKIMTYEVRYGIEAGLAPESTEGKNHERRKGIIKKRLGLDSEAYVVIPTALGEQLNIKSQPGQTIAPISKGKIKDADGKIQEIAIVPSGKEIGLTTKAAEQLKIPQGLKELRVRVEKGVLVMN